MALGMTYNGADGTTKDAMEATLELSGLGTDEVNQSYLSLIRLLTQLDPKVTFQIANSIWYREDIVVKQAFLDANREYFGAEVTGLDFASPDAVRTINAWVDGNTNGKIKRILDAIPPDVVIYLINAVYFKGAWTYKFDPNHTMDAQFTSSRGTTSPCRMMNLTGTFPYYEDSIFQLVDLPYGSERFSMTLLVPRASDSVDSLIQQITPERWSEWTERLTPAEGDLSIPRFKLEYERSLKGVLTDLGMGIAFGDLADFTKISQQGHLVISDVKHKTFVEVNEEGTEAAAVTSVEGFFDSFPSRFNFRADRPFIFAIRERVSGTILFIGKMAEFPTVGD
jgi:serpin B